MGRPKGSKNKTTKSTASSINIPTELWGVLLILVAVVGIFNFGVVGKFFCLASAFVVGIWYKVLLVLIFALGAYVLLKREKSEFLLSKTIGICLVAIGLLVLSELAYVKEANIFGSVVESTFENFQLAVSDLSSIKGAGIVGAMISAMFIKLFDFNGSVVIMWIIVGSGFVMFTGISIYDFLKDSKEKLGIKFTTKKTKEIVKIEEEYEEPGKVVINSMDDLKPVKKEEVVPEVKDVTEVIDIEIDGVSKPYILPPIDLLDLPEKVDNNLNNQVIKDNIKMLEQVFEVFGIEGKIIAANVGPAVTQYEMNLKAGTKLNKLTSLSKEIALAMGAKDVRIEAPIPGKKTVGIELPNQSISKVTLREVLEEVPSSLSNSKLLAVLGKNIMGVSSWVEINNTPHMLVAGSTGSGKSVCINSVIISILMRSKPDEVKLVLVDPKKVELSGYNGIPHLLTPVVTDPKKANIALKKIVVEMERRYEVFSETNVKNIAGYNAYIDKENKKRSDNDKIKRLPYILVIIDELADLMLVAAKEVEDSILRITQMARAAGIHLIVATQRPSTDVITGVVKSNIPSRLSFAVASQIDSRTILDMGGAEKLLGKGDMLFKPQDDNTPTRIQGTFVSEEEINRVIDYVIKQQKVKYEELMDLEEQGTVTGFDEHDATEEPLYDEIVEFVVSQQKASASLLQRRFRLGYNRAARAVDLLEDRGIIGPSNGSKPREVLVKLNGEEE